MPGEIPIEYFEIDAAPGLQFFRCDKLSATLSAKGCAQNYRQAAGRDQADRLYHCRNCPIGAHHNGERAIRVSKYYGGNLCARCHRPASRLIHKRICVSCQNREYEIVKGRNAKGTMPVRLPELHPQRVLVSIDGKVSPRRLERCVDATEAFLTILRTERGAIQFGFPPGQIPGLRQLRLLP